MRELAAETQQTNDRRHAHGPQSAPTALNAPKNPTSTFCPSDAAEKPHLRPATHHSTRSSHLAIRDRANSHAHDGVQPADWARRRREQQASSGEQPALLRRGGVVKAATILAWTPAAAPPACLPCGCWWWALP